tara:strand:+ start:146 stop:1426 length:1281 start_codon:yes stop_codon:yes gene_type:complete
MYGRYYRYPVKQKSAKTIESLSNVEKYEHVKQYSAIEKLKPKELDYQRELFEKDLNLILNEYSPINYEKRVLEFRDSIEKITHLYKELSRLYKKKKDNFIIKKRYFQEQTIMFPSRVEIQELTIDKEKLKQLLNEENKILQKINNNDIEEKRLYFSKILKMLKFYYLYYKIEIFDDNKKAFDHHISYSSKIKNDFKSNTQIDIPTVIAQFEGIEFDDVKEAINTLHIPNTQLKLSDCVEMDTHGDSKRKIIYINTTNYHKLSKHDGELEIYPKKTILDKSLLIKFISRTKDLINNILRKIELSSRKKMKQKEKKENFGYVYVLKSIGYPGMYKIGSTYGLAEERAEELSGTNVPDPWIVAAKIKILDALYYEKQAHKVLAKYRYKKGREFFKVDLSIIKECLKNITEISDKGRKKVSLSVLKKNKF